MAKRKSMTESELSALLDGQIADAESFAKEAGELLNQAAEYRDGVMKDLPPEENKSAVVSMDVQDTIQWIKPGLLRLFTGSDRLAEFKPKGPEDEESSAQATDYVNYLVMEECDGFKVVSTSIDDGLSGGNGLWMHWWDKSPCYEVETFSGLSEDAFTLLVDDDDVEVVEHTAYPDPQATFAAANPVNAPGMGGGDPAGLIGPAGYPASGDIAPGAVAGGQGGVASGVAPGGAAGEVLPAGRDVQVLPPAAQLHDVKIKRKIKTGKLRVEALPPEELLIPRDAKVIDEDIPGVGRKRFVTRSQLIKEGYKREIVDELPEYTRTLDNSADNARDKQASWMGTGEPDHSMEEVKIYEWYPLVDMNGDGVAERLRVIIGDRGEKDSDRKILHWEEWGDDLPFTDIIPDPVAHRRRGRSVFDAVRDIQRVKTALFRQMMNNAYMANEPMLEAVEGMVVNPDALANRELGATIWTKGQGAITTHTMPPIFDQVIPVIEYWDLVKQGRTGVGRQTMGLDPDALQNQTAEAVRDGRAANETQTEYYARNIAEGLRLAFRRINRLIIKNQDRPKTIRLRNQWVEIDPRPWNAEMDCSINVGLGAGSKDRDMVMLQAIAGKQEQILQFLGPDNPLVSFEQYRATLAEMVTVGGLKSAEKYFKEITPDAMQAWAEAQANKPDPKQMEIEAKMQADAQKAQMDAQLKERELQLKAQIEQLQAEADIAVEQRKTQAAIALEERKFEFERQLKMLEMQIHERTAERDAARKDQEMQYAAQERQAQSQRETAEKSKPKESDPGHTALAGALHAIAGAMGKPVTIRKGADGSYTRE